MKKIGILTLYHVRNLGACLQAMAMSEIIRMCGAKPLFIKGYDKAFAFELFKGDVGSIRPWTLPYQIVREFKFQEVFKQFEEIKLEDVKECDSVIVGSDSVWISGYGKMQMPNCFFGEINSKSINAYAPSVGGHFVESDYLHSQTDALSNFNFVGVRDDETKKFYEAYTNCKAEIVVDPTLLFDWNSKFFSKPTYIPNEDYIVVYGGFSPKLTKAIEHYGIRNHMRVINVGIYNRRFEKSLPVSPEEFLYFIKYSKCVITSMFHGVMMSIALNKQFRYIAMDENRNIKLSTSLRLLDLEGYVVNKELFTEDYAWEDIIDYSRVNGNIREYRASSMDLLSKMIGGQIK